MSNGSDGASAQTRDAGGQAMARLSRFALLGILIGLCLLFSVLKPETFGTWDNFRSILDNDVTIVFIALAATVPLIVGAFDLSVAAVYTWSQLIIVGLVIKNGWSPLPAIGVAFGSAIVVGLVNGIAVVRFKINSFIATLASGSILTGASLAYSNGESIFGKPPAGLTNIARNDIAGIPLGVL